jgi:4-hydroxy-tetrahydrodipicolinate reductase
MLGGNNMIRIILNGALGKVGRMITELAAYEDEMEIVAGIDKFAAGAGASFPLFEAIGDDVPEGDVLIDFSRPEALRDVLAFCAKRGMAVLLGTTGYTEEDVAFIREMTATLRVFRSANMSLGINLLMDLTREAAATLKGYDIELIEMHHNTKVDAPSGTALMLADGINRELQGGKHYKFGRHTKTERRQPSEIGIHAIRGGTIVGEHEILYIGQDEVISLKHTAQSRRIYAMGALRAAEYVVRCTPGLYNMQNLLAEQYSVTSLMIDNDQAMLTVWDADSTPQSVASLFKALGEAGVLVDMISQTSPRGGKVDVSFSLPREDVAKAMNVLQERQPEQGSPVVKLTIEGQGMEHQSGVAAKVLGHLAQVNVGIVMITTSETKISLLVEEKDEAVAIRQLREAFRFS